MWLEDWTPRQSVRLGVVIPLALFASVFLLIYAYLLLYWIGALIGPGGVPCDPAVLGQGACWRPEQRTFWLLGAASAVPAAICLVFAMRRVRGSGRWWPWPVAVVVLAVAAGWALGSIG